MKPKTINIIIAVLIVISISGIIGRDTSTLEGKIANVITILCFLGAVVLEIILYLHNNKINKSVEKKLGIKPPTLCDEYD